MMSVRKGRASVSIVEPNSGSAILVTGGCGFIGLNLMPYLAQRYRLVRVLDDLSAGDAEALKREWDTFEGPAKLDFTEGDVRDRPLVEKCVRGVEAVVHLAAQSGVVSSIKDPDHDYSVNVLGTFNVLEAARRAGVQSVVFASSSAAMGEKDPPVTEEGSPRPLSPYGASKLAAEGYCSAYNGSFGINTVALRFANVYGPHSTHKTSVVASFLSRALEGAPIAVYGDGSQTRDFIFVEDLCRAIMLALDANVQSGTYNIGTGTMASVNELITTLENVLGRNLEREHLPVRRGEVEHVYLNIDKARKLLGFDPKFSLEEGLKRTHAWFQATAAGQKSGERVPRSTTPHATRMSNNPASPEGL
jgi:UDP-glucose 4-epimerase